MKLPDKTRNRLFHTGQQLSRQLGSLFQNPMNITKEDVAQELAELNSFKFAVDAYEQRLISIKQNIDMESQTTRQPF